VARTTKPRVQPPVSTAKLAPEQQPVAPPTPEPVTPDPVRSIYPSQRTLARWLLVLLAIFAVGWLLWNALPALTPFIIGLVLAYLLLPIVNTLNRRMPRWAAILVVYLGGISVIAGSIAFIIPPLVDQIQQLIESFPSVDQLQEMGRTLLQEYRSVVPAAIQRPVEEGLRNALRAAQANVSTYVQSIGGFVFSQVLQVLNTLTFLLGFLIIPIWLFYVLNDQEKGRAFVNRVLHPRIRPDFWNIWSIINQVLSDYIRGQLLLGLAVGVMVGIGLFILWLIGFDVRYILLLAIVAGVTELIPIIGPIIGAIPGVLLGFFAGENGLQTGLAVLVVYIIVQQLENNLLVPRIIGESIGIHPAILTVVLIAMGQIFGLLGIILAAPAAAIGRDLFMYVYHRLEGLSAAAAREMVSAEGKPVVSGPAARA
jgi:predicted PurR-regulated permease PerM